MTPSLKPLITININNKSFHNSTNSSELYLQVYIPSCRKIFRFTMFRILDNAFGKLPCPWYELIINTLCKTIPHKFTPKRLFHHLPWKAFFHKKVSLYFKWVYTMPLLHWKIVLGKMTIMWRLCDRIGQWVEPSYKNWNVVCWNPFGHSIKT